MENPMAGKISSGVAVMALTATLYTAAKGATGYIPSPWGVGQLYLAAFVPAFFAVVSDTLPVAAGAAIGSFVGDVLFLVPSGGTNPALALAAGVPANFVGILVFGWLVKRFKSWSSFITSAVGAITLGNAVAAALVAITGPYLFAPLASLSTLQAKLFLTIGLTVFWDTTSITTAVILIPPLVRAVRPLAGRSRILTHYPLWSGYEVKSLLPVSVAYALVFLAVGLLYFFTPLGSRYVPDAEPVKTLVFVAIGALLIFGPVVGLMAGTRKVEHAIGTKSL